MKAENESFVVIRLDRQESIDLFNALHRAVDNLPTEIANGKDGEVLSTIANEIEPILPC